MEEWREEVGENEKGERKKRWVRVGAARGGGRREKGGEGGRQRGEEWEGRRGGKAERGGREGGMKRGEEGKERVGGERNEE